MVSGLESSLWYSAVTVIIALALGGGLAVVERLWQQPMRRWFTAFMLLPVFLPPVIVSTSFIATFGTEGLFPIKILYSPLAVILAYCYYNVPLAYLLIRSALNRISCATETASQLLGANRWQRFRTVLLAQLRLPLVGTGGIIFLYCFTSFILPLQLGGSSGQTLEVWLYQQIYIYHHYTTALHIALTQFTILVSVIAILLYLQPKITLLTSTPEFSNKPSCLFSVIHVSLASLVLLPLFGFVMKTTALISSTAIITLIESQLTMALGRTLLITLVTIMISIGLVGILRLGTKMGMALLALSPITLSFAWYQLFGKGYISLIGAFIMSIVPMTAIIIHQARCQTAKYITDTARILGAQWWQRWQLELSMLKPSLRQVVIFGSIMVMGDATISAQLAPAQHPLAMPYTMQLISSYRFPVGSLALLIMMVSICLIVTLVYARRS